MMANFRILSQRICLHESLIFIRKPLGPFALYSNDKYVLLGAFEARSISGQAEKLASSATTSETVPNNSSNNSPHTMKIRDNLDLSFNDARQAYRSKSTWEILRAWVVFKLCSVDYLVENNAKVSKIKLNMDIWNVYNI